MNAAAFFRLPKTARLLERASRCAAVPVSLHAFQRGREGIRLSSYGPCAACRYVSEQPGGLAACRASRETAANAALRRERPASFLCHMGFACIAVPPLPDDSLGLMLTFGPFCPAEEPRSLESDALRGLQSFRTWHFYSQGNRSR